MKNEKPNWGSNKNSRRSLVAQNYRIVMMVGDNLGDFVDGSDNKASAEIRLKAAEKYSQMWGTHWFMLANPLMVIGKIPLLISNMRFQDQNNLKLS